MEEVGAGCLHGAGPSCIQTRLEPLGGKLGQPLPAGCGPFIDVGIPQSRAVFGTSGNVAGSQVAALPLPPLQPPQQLARDALCAPESRVRAAESDTA
jgi:hypothetical protein